MEDAEAAVTADGKVAKGGVTYGPGDCIFVHPHTFDALEDDAADAPEVPAYAAKGRFHKGGANVGLRAFGIARVVGFAAPAGKKARPSVRPLDCFFLLSPCQVEHPAPYCNVRFMARPLDMSPYAMASVRPLASCLQV